MTKKTKKETLILVTKKNDQVLTNHKVQDLIRVKSGFARNYLLPKNFGILADQTVLRQQTQKQKNFQLQEEQLLQKSIDWKMKLEKIQNFEIKKRVGSTNKIFGKITSKQIFDLLTAKTGLVFTDQKISCSEMKELGTYPVEIILHPKVIAKIQLQILPK